jgi:hypothetical protein
MLCGEENNKKHTALQSDRWNAHIQSLFQSVPAVLDCIAGII